MMDHMSEVLVFQHDPFEDLGFFAEVLEKQGAEYRVIRLFQGEMPAEELENVGALIILWRLYQSTREGDVPRTLAIALVCAGAIGNLIDRVRYHEGVVDFIDVGFRDMRWPAFNVADMAVSTGPFLLAWLLWGVDRAERARAAEANASP